MDFTGENVNPNPRDKANPLSILFFTYTLPIFKKGYTKVLEPEDLYNPIRSDRSEILGDRLERAWLDQIFEESIYWKMLVESNTKSSWNYQKKLVWMTEMYQTTEKAKKKGKKPKLMTALIKAFWPEYSILAVTLFCLEIVTLIQPLMLGQLLKYFRPVPEIEKNDAFLYATGIVGTTLLSSVFMNQNLMCSFHYGMKVRAAACALIYRKSLRLSKTALGDTTSGKIVNLLSNDVSRFDLVTIFLHHMWIAPLVTLIVLYYLYVQAGVAGVVGIAMVFIVVPLQGYTGKLSAIYRKATAGKTDERVRLMDEILSGIQVIKMYAWEKPFTKLIRWARRSELDIVIKSSYVRAIYMTFNLFTTRLSLFCTLLTLALMDKPITASTVFVIQSYLQIVAQTMSQMFVRGISEIAELVVAIKRLELIMLSEEKTVKSIGLSNNNFSKSSEKHTVALQNLTSKWNSHSPDICLHSITLNASRGQLLGVIGPVGSGKSSLLQTILGELEVVSGKIEVNGTVSYASQDAWVFAATVRQNILFGSEYDKKRYHDVVMACALEKDFEQFPNGDLTIVGDRGASLSGGQKARINLARAIYRVADVYLLDDPLSAVDVHVSKHLYDLCIQGYLAHKTRILVTHQVHHLKDADHILILNNGRIENEGSFKELSESDNLYAKLLTSEPSETEEKTVQRQLSSANLERQYSRKLSVKSIRSLASAMSELSIPEAVLATADEDSEDEEDQRKANIKEMREESSKGKVKGNLLLKYMHAGVNWVVVITVFSLYLAAQTAASGADYFVSLWTKVEEKNNNPETVSNCTTFESTGNEFTINPDVMCWETKLFIQIYGSIIVAVFVFALVRSVSFYQLAMKSSQRLHDTAFDSVISAPMRFFDTNPSGRILNRFSKDMGAVDELLPKAILDAGQYIFMGMGSIILITVVNPWFLIIVAAVGAFCMVLRHIFLKSSKNIKRLEGMMRSPAFTHLNATLLGLTTIRAFGAQEILRAEFDKHQDIHTSAWFMYIAASSAFGMYMDLLCFIFVTVVTFSFLTFGSDLGLSGGEVGLAITQSMALTGLVQWGLRQSAEVSNQLMSVERVLEYKNLAKEQQPLEPKHAPEGWPDKGHIQFQDMGLRYDEKGALVLKKLNLSIQAREKVGIVGRTGAGKSSLISALFRLAPVEGGIVIDGIDTKELALEQLRSKISIIPQDPVLFSGNLRNNLDPFEEFSDEVLYRAIEDVELKDSANIINALDYRVLDRGANYSVGQRQLICLARAIIRNNKILMLDEATANVDPQTDALIQKTIRKKFADCTVLTVAHRLNTIMDSDKVLVMDFGMMVEFDHPHILLQNQNSVFNQMVNEAGKSVAEALRKIAKDSYQRQHALPE